LNLLFLRLMPLKRAPAQRPCEKRSIILLSETKFLIFRFPEYFLFFQPSEA
jgi:hypothetical protein